VITGVNDKTNWEKRLAKTPVVPEYETQPDYGWYRLRTADGTSWNRYFFYYGSVTGCLCCKFNGSPISEDRAIDIWVRAREYPITKELYDLIEGGGQWPDEHPLIGMLHNRPPEEDTLEWLRDQLDPLVTDANRLMKAGPAKTEEAADEAALTVNVIAALSKRVETAKARERAPLAKRVIECDDRWRPLVAASGIYQALKQAVHVPFLLARRREKEAAEAKARAEAAEKQRLAREAQRRAEDEAALAVVTGSPEDTAKAEEVAAEAKATAQDAAFAAQAATEIAQRTVTAGGPGQRGIHLRAKKRAVIQDPIKVFEVFQTNAKVLAELQKAADRAVQAGVVVPGVKVVEDYKAA
jgi:hypothetical protein